MDKDSEEWNAKEWLSCLALREKVMADYLELLQRYNGLPAVDALVERDLLKKYSQETLDDAFEAIVPPVNYVLHEWDRVDDAEMCDEESEAAGNGENGKKDKETRLGETCYTGISDIINSWVECLKVSKPPLLAKFTLSVLEALSQVGCYIFSACSVTHSQQDSRSVALIQLSINKCILIEQCMVAYQREMEAIPELLERLQGAITHLEVLRNLLKEYLGEVLMPGNKN